MSQKLDTAILTLQSALQSDPELARKWRDSIAAAYRASGPLLITIEQANKGADIFMKRHFGVTVV